MKNSLLWPLCYCLIIFPAHAQDKTHREATLEERKLILPGDGEEKLKKLGDTIARQSENSVFEKAIIQKTIDQSILDQSKMKSYIQHLTNQGLSQTEIQEKIEILGQEYFAELQLKNLGKVLSKQKQKQYAQRFDQKLSQKEMDQEVSRLDAEVSASPFTKENEQKVTDFKKGFLTVAQDNTFVKVPLVTNPKFYSPIQIMVPIDFSLTQLHHQSPLCLDRPQLTVSKQFDQLNSQIKSLTKPLVHQIWFSWGYNRAAHSKTDVEFTTKDGTFMIHDAVGKDRQSPLSLDYINPSTISVAQYNLELGVMFNEKWGMDFHMDHMKYVFDNKRPYEITGDYSHQVVIKNDHPTNQWDEEIPVDFAVAKAKKDATWLRFEHTNGYNYASLGLVYNQKLYATKNNKISIDARLGAGAGLIIPKTEVWIAQDQRWNRYGIDNKFHVAGGGVHGDARLKVTFWDSVFLQVATRGTYIKVKDALVNGAEARLEHIQPIASVQIMGQIGYQHTIGKKKVKKKQPADQ